MPGSTMVDELGRDYTPRFDGRVEVEKWRFGRGTTKYTELVVG